MRRSQYTMYSDDRLTVISLYGNYYILLVIKQYSKWAWGNKDILPSISMSHSRFAWNYHYCIRSCLWIIPCFSSYWWFLDGFHISSHKFLWNFLTPSLVAMALDLQLILTQLKTSFTVWIYCLQQTTSLDKSTGLNHHATLITFSFLGRSEVSKLFAAIWGHFRRHTSS